MLTSPPYLAILNGSSPVPLPSTQFTCFCDGITAQNTLKKVQVVCPDAIVVDIVHTPINQLPPGVAPYPVDLFGPLDGSTITIWVIYGTLPEVGETVTGTISEYAGTLFDDSQPPYGALERELGGLSSETPAGTPTVFAVYDSPYDPEDPEIYSKVGVIAMTKSLAKAGLKHVRLHSAVKKAA